MAAETSIKAYILCDSPIFLLSSPHQLLRQAEDDYTWCASPALSQVTWEKGSWALMRQARIDHWIGTDNSSGLSIGLHLQPGPNTRSRKIRGKVTLHYVSAEVMCVKPGMCDISSLKIWASAAFYSSFPRVLFRLRSRGVELILDSHLAELPLSPGSPSW